MRTYTSWHICSYSSSLQFFCPLLLLALEGEVGKRKWWLCLVVMYNYVLYSMLYVVRTYHQYTKFIVHTQCITGESKSNETTIQLPYILFGWIYHLLELRKMFTYSGCSYNIWISNGKLGKWESSKYGIEEKAEGQQQQNLGRE